MVIEITFDSVLIFLAFLIVVFVLYKLFKLIIRASLVIVAAFAFPWVARYAGLQITANLETGMMFAFVGFGLFVVYEFIHFIIQFFRMLLWPFKKKKVS
jgi:lipoprotein signal peptidase